MPEHRTGELGEEALDEVEPGAMLRCESELEAPGGLSGEPSSGFLGDMRRMVVEDQMDRGLGRIGAVDELEEFDEFPATVAILDQSVDLATDQVDAGQQANRAVALVFVVRSEEHTSE